MYVSSMSVVTELPIGDCRSAFEARLEEMIARMRFKFAAASALKHLPGRTNTLGPVGHRLNLTKVASSHYRRLATLHVTTAPGRWTILLLGGHQPLVGLLPGVCIPLLYTTATHPPATPPRRSCSCTCSTYHHPAS